MELLATMTILAIVLPVIYGVFQSGLSLYNKIQIEGQLRDDADYAISMMLNSFNSIPFDYVKQTDETKIELYDAVYTKLEPNKEEDPSFYAPKESENEGGVINSRSIELINQTANGQSTTSVSINGEIVEGNGDFSDSSLILTCKESDRTDSSKCLHGIIEVTFIIDQSRLNKPLTLESQFGF